MKKIYDCVPFFNELDILELRLELLYDHVDHFIISECDYTFSGIKKPFYFEENKEKFGKYMDKIIHLKHYDTEQFIGLKNKYIGKKGAIYQNILNKLEKMISSPETDHGKPHWCRDYLHKELTMLGMDVCDPDDIILFGDLDEIPDPEKLILDGNNYVIHQKNMMYHINTENITQKWYGTYICKFSEIKNNSCMETRNYRFNFEHIENAGWHLSFMGGTDRIKEKLKSYGHQEFNNTTILDNIGGKMKNNKDILNRNIVLTDIDIIEYYPNILIDLVDNNFKYLIK